MISQLSAYRKHFITPHNPAKFREYLKTHFTSATPTHQTLAVMQGMAASTVDCEG